MPIEKKVFHIAFAAAVLGSTFFVAGECAAASKEECIDAHSQGQDLREKGQLSRARQLFLTCAQSSCPALVQSDCARFGDELEHVVPTVSFGARDAKANDLPNTNVYVDDVLVTTHLDDGKSHEVDPGKHTVRFVHDGKTTILKVVLNQGEKGRSLIGTFVDGSAPADNPSEPYTPPSPSKRSAFPLVVAGLGVASLATGSILIGLGLHKVPSGCSVSSRECTAPPGDPMFDDARSGMSMANLGLGLGIGGAALLGGGLIWYFVQPTASTTSEARPRIRAVSPWVARDAGGVALSATF